jgi:hypothetical protein
MCLGVLRLREADRESEDEEEGEDGNDALERMKFSLHWGESSLASSFFVIGSSCPDWSMDCVAVCPTPKKNANRIRQ